MVRLAESITPTVPGSDGTGWEPRIAAMVCNWCTYAGADMAGTARMTYPPNIRTVRFLCTGRIDPMFIVKAFEQGADGVLISGCHPGDCHYVQGNMLTRRRHTIHAALMDFLGLDRRRLHYAWVSASEGVKWAKVVGEVTESVREAGPLLNWGKPGTSESLRLPDPGEAPRIAPPPEVYERISVNLRQTAADLLTEEEGGVSMVIGYTPGTLPGQMVPAFVTSPDEAPTLAWSDGCGNNLSMYIPEVVKKQTDGKVGLVVKKCDAKALIGLMRENQLNREQVSVLGIPCAGLWQDGKLASKCYGCDGEATDLSDWTITAEGAQEGAATTEEQQATAPDPRDIQIAALEAVTPETRWAYWQNQFARCIRCYACRAVCPLCYCETCIADKHRPQWIPKSFDGPGNTSWNIARAMHLAGRCTGCDECTRVCPADIRLDLLNRHLSQEIETQFDYRADDSADIPPPLTTFRPDDPDEFM